MIAGRTVLEPGAPIVWFTFPGAWHDIGRFHLADGRFTGVYANILAPVRFIDANTWETTDLFLDIWADETGAISVLDVDELSDAVITGWVDEASAARGRREAADIVVRAERGEWPPAIVSEWTLERARLLAGPD